MILLDLSQVMIANLMQQIGNHQNAEVEESMLRHMILNTLRHNRRKFRNDFGELVICADDKHSWRKGPFPYYKANRKKSREESEMDWDSIFNSLSKIREEIKEHMPYKVILVPGAEADDIIGTIVHRKGTQLNTGEQILILSGDKDFVQLHQYGNVRQYSPTLKAWVSNNDPEEYLYQHILKGDKGDGIPNVMMPDNFLVAGEGRQKSITKKRIDMWRKEEDRDDTIKRNFLRNQHIIDLTETPHNIQEQIMEDLEKSPIGKRSGIMNYFMENRLKMLMEHLTDF